MDVQSYTRIELGLFYSIGPFGLAFRDHGQSGSFGGTEYAIMVITPPSHQ